MIKVFKTPNLFKWIFHRRVWGFSDSKAVYLTFDDGPTKELTPWILNFLKEKQVKATFFCVGANAAREPALMESIRKNGHAVGNHTMYHENGVKTSKADYMQSIEEASQHIQSNLFRPPYGRLPVLFTKKIRQQYSIIMWSWLSYDYDPSVDIDVILKSARKEIKGGDILVVHDNMKTTDRLKELLPALIDIVREKGLEFRVISA